MMKALLDTSVLIDYPLSVRQVGALPSAFHGILCKEFRAHQG
jgi:hypothetical protein